MMLEAKIEILREKNENIHQEIKLKKMDKNKLYTKRDELIDKKRQLQNVMFGVDKRVENDSVSERMSQLSKTIGEIIEKSKALSTEIQLLYDETRTNPQQINILMNELKEIKNESDVTILSYKRKIAIIDNELAKLRNKMKETRNKLEADN